MKEHIANNIYAQWHGDYFTLFWGPESSGALMTMTPNVWMKVNEFVAKNCVPQGFGCGCPTGPAAPISVTDQITKLEALRNAIPGEPCGGTSDTCTNPGHNRYWDLTCQINDLTQKLHQ